MHHEILSAATHEQLLAFLTSELDTLKARMPDLYDDMECDLYMAVYGPHFSESTYTKAVNGLINNDGTTGPHWSAQQVLDYARSRGVTPGERFNQYDLAYVMNMMYSDYHGAVQDTTESYLRLASAFLTDPDAPDGKAFLYWKAMH